MRKPNLDRRFNHYNREYTLILIHQAYFLLKRLLERYKADFLEKGGIKEQMSAARRNWREEHGLGYLNGKNVSYGRNVNNSSTTGMANTGQKK